MNEALDVLESGGLQSPDDDSWEDFLNHDDEEPCSIVNGVLRDEGTVVLFSTTDDRVVAVDHREAQGLVDLLRTYNEVPVFVEDWQVLG